jgi:hypothetical protein
VIPSGGSRLLELPKRFDAISSDLECLGKKECSKSIVVWTERLADVREFLDSAVGILERTGAAQPVFEAARQELRRRSAMRRYRRTLSAFESAHCIARSRSGLRCLEQKVGPSAIVDAVARCDGSERISEVPIHARHPSNVGAQTKRGMMRWSMREDTPCVFECGRRVAGELGRTSGP